MAVTIDGVGEINGVTLPTGDGAIAKTSDLALVHINTTSFTAVSSVSLNDVFSADYNDYLVKIRVTASAAGICASRLRVGGADASGASYAYQRTFAAGTSLVAARATGATFAPFTVTRSTGVALGVITLVSPFVAEETNFLSHGIDPNGTLETIYGGAKHSLATSYSGITVFPESGTITGTIRVFGYKNGVSA